MEVLLSQLWTASWILQGFCSGLGKLMICIAVMHNSADFIAECRCEGGSAGPHTEGHL